MKEERSKQGQTNKAKQHMYSTIQYIRTCIIIHVYSWKDLQRYQVTDGIALSVTVLSWLAFALISRRVQVRTLCATSCALILINQVRHCHGYNSAALVANSPRWLSW